MKITVLNGSPRKQNTTFMVDAFVKGAEEAGHTVEVIQVGKMKIAGCLGCEYCHGKGEGQCIQKDDMEKVYPAYQDSDMIVFASPIYYFGMTAQIMAAIQRVYALMKWPKATKAALLLSSMSPNVYDGAIGTYKGILAFTGIEDAGIFTAKDPENGSEALQKEIYDFAKGL
ncbi:MAG: flavodoxin family protein [Firmicutes bacterium]|nr:flavodoxin family protein [Bacillota bacterium]